MKRVIKDFKTITPEVMALINDQYPYGYEDSQLVTFVNAKGEFVKALEVRTDEVVYLIKLDRKLDEHINDYMDSDGDADASADGDDTISFDSDTNSVDVEMEDTSDEEED
jgi:hypothetical protein